MSGDVQPRKRRDKKRKKDETGQGDDTVIHHSSSSSNNDDFNIHVHKESSTGGGICAKIVFFCLLGILGVLIGLIIIEHRGLTDLDTVDPESKYAKIFDGWTEAVGHDDHDDESHSIIHDEEHDDEEDARSIEAHEEEASEEEDTTEDDEPEVEGSEEDQEETEEVPQDTEEDVEETEEEQQLETEEDDDDENDDNATEEEDEEEQSAEKYNASNAIDDDEDEENASEIASPEENEEDDTETKEQPDNVDDDDGDDDNDSQDQQDNEEESTKSEEEAEKVDVFAETESKKNEDAEDAADISEDKEDGVDNSENKEETDENVEQATAGDSNKSTPSHSENTPTDLSRRKTIVVPPTLDKVEQQIENPNVEYSEDEYSEECSDEEEITLELRNEHIIAKQQYVELRSTYTRSLTPESEPEYEIEEDVEIEGESQEEEEEIELDSFIPEVEKPFGHDDEEEVEEGDGEDEGGEDDDEEEEEISDNDDEELLKKLEAKYGKLTDDDSEDENQFQSWKKVNVLPGNAVEDTGSETNEILEPELVESVNENITNSEDWVLKDELDYAQEEIQNNVAKAFILFEKILERHPRSPRAAHGKALALDKIADIKKSNDVLMEAINAYIYVLTLNNVPNYLFKISAERCIDRMRFRGQYTRAIGIHNMLIKNFPNEPEYPNQLAVTYLTMNKLPEAKKVLHQTLLSWRNNGFAMVHYGFVLKVYDNDFENAINFLKEGIATKEPGVIDGRFYFHLGDALVRTGRTEEALEIYKDGVINKVFPSVYQRSLYNVHRLKATPWWDIKETPFVTFFHKLKKNWKIIRDEGLSLLNKNGYFRDESENLKDKGEWKQLELFVRGNKVMKNCEKCPFTCKIIETLADARSCRRGQSKFSVMHPGTHIWPHCGPTNCRLRSHLGLNVPTGTFIRVANETRTWKEGELLIFDDSFEHEVWHNGTAIRLVLIVDIWHPELTETEKRNLPAI